MPYVWSRRDVRLEISSAKLRLVDLRIATAPVMKILCAFALTHSAKKKGLRYELRFSLCSVVGVTNWTSASLSTPFEPQE